MIGQKTSVEPDDRDNYPAISQGVMINKLLNFLRTQLPNVFFVSDLRNAQKIKEDYITGAVYRFLSDNAHLLSLSFDHQMRNSEGKIPDISIRPINGEKNSYFFTIEAKRLYSGTSGSGTRKHYVCGDIGGIERFKKNSHGKKMKKSAMFGYVQDHDFCHWHQKINSWIDEESWGSSERLKDLEYLDEKLTECESTHSRIDNTNITLIHFWLDFQSP